MADETTPVRVLFRMESGGNVLALFPDIPADHAGQYVTCYAHIGQHSSATYAHVLTKTRPATPAEYADLKRELEGAPYGYRFIVCKRR